VSFIHLRGCYNVGLPAIKEFFDLPSLDKMISLSNT
jgi:hypothetical protein